MRFGFTAPATKSITLTRGGETVRIELQALPPGYLAWLRRVFPPPVEFVNGKEVPAPAADQDYRDLFAYIAIAKSIEGMGVLTSTPPSTGGRPLWERYGISIREEFRAAHFTDGETNEIARAVMALAGSSAADVEDAAGN